MALATGGALRIGRALAMALAGRGAKVAVHFGNSSGAAAETVAEIVDRGGAAESFQADLRNIPETLEEIASRFDPISSGMRLRTEVLFDPC